MKPLAYCPQCSEEVDFDTRIETETTELDGHLYSYETKRAYCRTCGSAASYLPYLEEAGNAFGDAVRSEQGIVTLAVVRDLPKRYGIGKRPLSRLLGWGELTYSRFVDGAIPSKEYSDRIQHLYGDAQAYYSCLKGGRGRISEHAYNKSKRAVERILDKEYPGYTKVQEVAYFFMSLANGDLTNSALNKLIYYAHGFSYRFLPQPLIQQRPKAWTYGPVYGQVWHDFENICREELATEDLADESPFSCEEEDYLIAVYSAFGRYSGSVLSDITHTETPWLAARERGAAQPDEPSDEPIDLKEMSDYFKAIAANAHMASPRDISRYARSKAKEIR
ncbi:Panacea domain-containing protein [Adlercreutzia murintestinalis]|jgi:Uncharacterized phage-associated protein|uniref:Panacea domain-containing protein n=1 Tax=Adlercreutzia murintestinalis TaxID=2941325 RepID=UPI00203AE0E9|nr:type II toxin-antitoxin system antitoxin SocA domain-containing protein [Adlercreutzia murintestinalis]